MNNYLSVMFVKDIKKYILPGIIFVSLIGTLFHFVYGWSGNNVIIGLFTPVNESIWEHTKLIFFPMMIYSLFFSKKTIKQFPCITSAMIIGSIIGISLIISLFYTYSGIIGFNIALVDILIFYISVVIAFLFVYKKAISCKTDKCKTLLIILQIIMICLYVIFTFSPLNIPLFISPT